MRGEIFFFAFLNRTSIWTMSVTGFSTGFLLGVGRGLGGADPGELKCSETMSTNYRQQSRSTEDTVASKSRQRKERTGGGAGSSVELLFFTVFIFYLFYLFIFFGFYSVLPGFSLDSGPKRSMLVSK